jgi:signal transduction histidine kinase
MCDHACVSRRCAAAAALVLIAVPVSALDPSRAVTQYSARTWHGGADAPDAAIQAIAQTPDGYLWLGTMRGLLRFDGARYTVFDRKSGHLPNDNVWALRVDRAGRLWAGTDGGGVARWDGERTEMFAAGSGLAADVVRPILETRDGAVWIGTRGGGISRYHEGRWTSLTTKQGLASDNVWSLAEAPDGTVWVGADGVNRCGPDACRVVRTQAEGLPHYGVIALAVARSGDLWVGTWGGLSRLRDGQWSDWNTRHGLPGAIVRAIHEDRDGNIWVGTSEGLARFDDGTFHTMRRDQGAAGGYVRALFEDRDGALWVGSAGSGLTALRDGHVLNIGEPEGLARGFVFSVREGPDGSVWAGTSHGLGRWKDGRARTFTTRDGLPDDLIGPTAVDPADPRGLWIGTPSAGLVYWIPGRGVMERHSAGRGLPSSAVACLYFDRRGGLWVGTDRGLAERRGGAWRVYTTADGLPSNNVRAVLEGRDGTVWAGTYEGLARREAGRWSADVASPPPPRAIVNGLHEDADGVLWVATSTSGLGRLQGRTWQAFDTARGFCSSVAYQVVEDDLGHLWTNSLHGLCRASRKALDTVARGDSSALPWRAFGRGDGMRDPGCGAGYNPAAWKAADGRLLFATNAGIVVVDPRKLPSSSPPPSVSIEGLSADGVSLAARGPVTLGPGRPRLELRFTTLSLPAADRVRFRYRLDGFDPDWVDAGRERIAHYTNVPPGRYTFRVSAADSDGVWNEAAAALAFVVRPHFWETAWFASLCVLAALGVATAAYRIRLSRVRAELAAVIAERTRVARELHDTLAQGVAGAKLQVESALETIDDRPASARRFLELGRALLSSSLSEVRRSIWVLRAQAGRTEEGLGPMLSQSLALLTADSGVETHLRLSGKEPALPSEMERHLLRIAHEAVTNAVRHGHPRTLAVDVRFAEEALELCVRDDGTGFDPRRYLEGRGGDHFGLRGLHERTKAIGGSLDIRSAPGAGTEVTCRVPYDAEDVTRGEG